MNVSSAKPSGLQFMDHLSNNCHLAAVNSQARGTLARRLFDQAGREVKALSQIEEGMSLWLSHGEAWIDPFSELKNNRKIIQKKSSFSLPS